MIRKTFALAAAVVAILALAGHNPPAVQAQTYGMPGSGIPVAALVSADDTDVAMIIRYVGSGSSADVAVSAGGDLTFRVAASAYTGFECPVSGALGGIIDASDAACNTLGEIVDVINGYCTGCSSDFRAVLVDGLRSDSADDTLLTFGTTEVTRIDGLNIAFDTDVFLGTSRALIENRTATGFMSSNGLLKENPYRGTQTILNWLEGKSTYGSGTSLFKVYSVLPVNRAGYPGSETVTTLWSEATGATTVNKQLTQFQYIRPRSRPNEKMIVRIENSAAMATVGLMANGEVVSVRP